MLDQNGRDKLTAILGRHDEVAFAYLHGSSLSERNHRDVDVAVFYTPAFMDSRGRNGSVLMDSAIPLEEEIAAVIDESVDVQVLNGAPLPFRNRVVTHGLVIVDRSPGLRDRFELFARVEYFDFLPRRREYLRKALA